MIDGRELLALAEALRFLPKSGKTAKQISLRRAVSSAYYALFHFMVDLAACEIAGTDRRSPEYRLVYRNFQHGEMKQACKQAANGLPEDLKKVLHLEAFDTKIRSCAALFVELQKLRHDADYDPGARITVADTRSCIDKARTAIENLTSASRKQRRYFLLMLHFRART